MKLVVILVSLIILVALVINSFFYTVFTSPFIKRMSIYDLRARSSSDKNFKCKYLYAWYYYSTIRSLNFSERSEIEKLNSSSKININYIKIMNDKNPEMYPHTIGSYIILPHNFFTHLNSEEKLRILKHEQVHIDQRTSVTSKLPSETSKRPSETRKSLRAVEPLRRNNPDTDDLYYEGYMWKYSSEYPKSIDDVIKLSEYEHSFEEEAYLEL